MFSNNDKIEKAGVTLRAVDFESKFVKVCLGDAFVYNFPKPPPLCLANRSSLGAFYRFMLTSQRIDYEC